MYNCDCIYLCSRKKKQRSKRLMKKLSFKSIVSLLLVVLLTFSVVYMPGMSFEASAACADGCSFTREQIGEKYLKEKCTVQYYCGTAF